MPRSYLFSFVHKNINLYKHLQLNKSIIEETVSNKKQILYNSKVITNVILFYLIITYYLIILVSYFFQDY